MQARRGDGHHLLRRPSSEANQRIVLNGARPIEQQRVFEPSITPSANSLDKPVRCRWRRGEEGVVVCSNARLWHLTGVRVATFDQMVARLRCWWEIGAGKSPAHDL